MENLGVILRVDEPTQWCAGIVVVPKNDTSVRICVNFRQLNENVLREVHPIPKIEDALAQLHGAVMFSKVDANYGFWQVPLDEGSKPLTTYITPIRRYNFNKLPFGINSAPEHFQCQMNTILLGLPQIDVIHLATGTIVSNLHLHTVKSCPEKSRPIKNGDYMHSVMVAIVHSYKLN